MAIGASHAHKVVITAVRGVQFANIAYRFFTRKICAGGLERPLERSLPLSEVRGNMAQYKEQRSPKDLLTSLQNLSALGLGLCS